MDPIPEDWRTAVVIVAHPDDIEYGAAAAVARWTAQGKDVRYVLATSGEAGIAGLPPERSKPVREEEQRRSAAVVGVSQVEFLGHPDGRLVSGTALRRDLAAAIRRHRPDVVVTAHFGDTWSRGRANSADHRVLGRAALDAVSDAANEWIFPELAELPAWDGVRFVAVAAPDASHAVDVTGYTDVAARSLAEHARYLAALSDTPVDVQAREQVDTVTAPRDGFSAERAVAFEVYWFT
ncbi:PIG-L family deacetylase [Rhodococcus rhodnii]|nr:PIG-L deacetylase family protein [Rhodococcus rhodnii]TXG90901.1 PIG-L family deacetylase [Rhodococcus rhodnii]